MTARESLRKNDIHLALTRIYNLLFKLYGPRRWWPADNAFEVAVGAILTQNTNWANVKKAISNLKDKNALNSTALSKLSLKKLARLIRPSGYYNIKARRLKNFLTYLVSAYSGDVSKMRFRPLLVLRKELLGIKGIGQETADSILLYAVKKPIFVIDAYTRRILACQGIINAGSRYEEIQDVFMGNLPHRLRLFNEYHALLVEHAKSVCTTKPNCSECILRATGVAEVSDSAIFFQSQSFCLR